MEHCKYSKDCDYYHDISRACNNIGGTYFGRDNKRVICGKYRERENEQNTNKQRDTGDTTATE